MLASVIEAVGVHSFLISRNKNMAIFFLILHVYLLINLIGNLKAIVFRKHLVTDQKLLIRYGLFDTVEIPINSISKINKFEGDYQKSTALVKFALLGKLEPHNISIELKNNISVNLPFGITKNPNHLLFYIDDANKFLAMVAAQIENKENLFATSV